MRTTRFALAALAAAAAACAHKPPRPEVVWPAPPEKPRIKFVTAFRGTDDLDTSGWRSFTKALLGASQDETFPLQPMGIAVSEDGRRVYVADYKGGQIVLADLEDRKVSRFAPDQPLRLPFNVALDADENVYVSDAGARVIYVLDRKGRRLGAIGQSALERPTGLALDRKRRVLYVTDCGGRDSSTHRVVAFDLDGKLLREVGRGKGTEEGQFYFPTYLAVGPDGSLYVADTLNFRIQVFDPGGRFLRQYGEPGNTPGTFSKLKGLAFDGFGNLYAVEADASVVQIFNSRFEPLMWFGGFAAALEYFDIPSCIAIEPRENRIYVCNEHYGRVNVYQLVNPAAADSFLSTPAPAAAPDAKR